MLRSKNSGGSMSMFEEKMNESRCLLQKDRFQQGMKMVHEFLLGLGFPGTISVKSLHTTAPNDFHKVYQFIHHFSEASFRFPPNGVEGETVELLKDLRYPVALFGNSVCLAVHHPELLGRLWIYWLKDWIINWKIVKMMCQVKAKESSSLCDVEEGAEFNKPLMEYCRDTYGKFLQAADSIEKKDKALINKLFKWFKLDKMHFIPQQKKHRAMMEGLETMGRECQCAHGHNHLKQEESRPQHNLEKQKFTPEDNEQDNQESEEQSLQRYIDEINQLMRNISDSHTKLEGNGAAGVEREGTKTQKSQGGKKARRKGRN